MQRLWGVVTDGLRAIPYAPVTVYVAGTPTLATIYDANGGLNPSSVIGNPVIADGLGRWIFAVPDGEYTVVWKPTEGPEFQVPYWTVGAGGIPVFVGASPSADGTSGTVPAPLMGDETKFLRGDATWATVALPSDMTGASGIAPGVHGLAPAPAAGDQAKFLRGDATWQPVTIPPIPGSRLTATATTGTLASGASEDLTITLPKSASILKLETDYPARVRLYLNATYRTADAARLTTVDPSGDHGCVLEFITVAGALTYYLSPVAVWGGISSGVTGYLAIANADTVSRAITLTLGLLDMEV